jgi:uncharacterized protein DUF4071
MPQPRPLCFVVMPFGTKPDGRGGKVDFDAVYDKLIAPAVEEAELVPLRADHELVGGLIHKPMFERLLLADFAVADLTTANANVFYEIGVRHAVRPFSTVLIGADVPRTPFDLAADRIRPYKLDRSGRPAAVTKDKAAIVEALRFARKSTVDSPVFQLVDLQAPDVSRLKTDVFRERVEYSIEAKRQLAQARAGGVGALEEFERGLGPLEDVEAGVLVDLLLSYRAVSAWKDMVRLVEALPMLVQRTVLVQEQYGLALNRADRGDEAEEVLKRVLEEHGPSSETYGILGRVHKDRWDAERTSRALRARGHLDAAITAYRAGFEADWRDAYPGVNAVTLMEIRTPGGDEQKRLAPVVRYANERRMASGAPDYWDHATQLELAIIERDRELAGAAAGAALAAVRESWEPDTTANNLSLIREARADAGETIEWADAIEKELRAAADA